MTYFKVYNLAEEPRSRKRIDTWWVLKVKEDQMGNVTKYKARWVVKGYMQSYGIDKDFTHAPVYSM